MRNQINLKLLVIEDNPGDLRLVQFACMEQDRAEVDVHGAESVADGLEALRRIQPDLVLLDMNLPDMSGMDALPALRQVQAGVPVIMLTGVTDQELAYDALKAGAQDYIVKGTFTGDSLVRACVYAIERARLVHELEEYNARLRTALNRIHDLEKLLPICAYCKNIRATDGSWTPVESFLEVTTDKQLTHGICPNCLRKHDDSLDK